MSLFELLLFVLVIASFVVFSHVTRQAARKARQEEQARQAEALAEADAVDDHAWGRHPTAVVAESTEQPAQYEWGRRPEAVVVPPSEPFEADRNKGMAVSPVQARTTERLPSPPIEAPRVTLRPVVDARRLFASRADLRHAVIAMTVLGPCRALEPPDLPDASQPLPRSR
jgi:hypothetical protein